MRFPLLWIAAALCAGVFLAARAQVSPNVALLGLPLAAALLLAAFLFIRARSHRAAWALGLLAWTALGGVAASLHVLDVPKTRVTHFAVHDTFESKDPLRWRGRLRSDPVHLPWGLRYEIELDEVEAAARAHPITGGLRVSYFRNTQQPEREPLLRAGDRVEALVRARAPRNFQNPGAFDARTHLARQGTHLTASLRSLELLQRLESPPPTLAHRSARARGYFLQRIDELFRARPDHAAALRAILLGDYSFIDHDLAETFQKTAAYHVLVISGLHVAALAAFVFWLARRARLPLWATSLLTLAVLGSFVAIVEDRPPIERAALMAVLLLAAGLLFRKVALLNTIGAAVLLMIALRPDSLADPSFQLSFLAGAMIGALALPLVERTSARYRDALAHLTDTTRDDAHAPRIAQFRLDLRALAAWLAQELPMRLQRWAPGVVAAPPRFVFALWDVFLVSTVIQLGMLPLLAHYFHRVSLAGPLANVPAAILSALLVPVGLLALVAATMAPWIASVLAACTSLLTSALLGSVSWFGRWEAASYRVPGPPAWLAILFFISIIATSWVLLRHASTRRLAGGRTAAAPRRAFVTIPGVVSLFACTTAIAIFPFGPQIARDHFEMTVLDVGQGDSLFLAFPDGRTMLLDGGGQFGAARAGGFRTGLDLGEQVVSPYLWSRGLKRIDVVALSHAHLDHLEGLFAVLENFEAGELWVARDVPSESFAALLRRAQSKGVRVIHKKRGDAFDFGGVSGLVLWPESVSGAEAAFNNDSLVLRFEFGEHSFLLPGDIESEVERELFAREDPLSADVLKVSHHGSRTSTTADFALAVVPRVAVMSLSESNPFGHPHAQVLDLLRAMEAHTLRTDRDGAVTISSDGKLLRVSRFKPEK